VVIKNAKESGKTESLKKSNDVQQVGVFVIPRLDVSMIQKHK
jgi:hypothetical protein